MTKESLDHQQRMIVSAAFGLSGFACAVGLMLFGDTSPVYEIGANNSLLLVVSGPSAAVAGFACGGLFGHHSHWGWFGAGFGGILATLLGAMLGGTLLAPLIGTVWAPPLLFANLITFPLSGLVWVASMAGLHTFIRRMRVEL